MGESDVDGPGQGDARLASVSPPWSEDMAMRLSSRFLSNLTLVFSSIALLLSGPGGTALAATDPSGSSSLPSITVQAPKPVARPHRPVERAVTHGSRRRAVSRERSPATSQPGGEGTVLERLKRLERTSHSCDDGCSSSFPKGNRPWVGCSASAFPQPSAGCRNPRHFTSYVQCTEHVIFLSWLSRDAWWYCSNLALNK